MRRSPGVAALLCALVVFLVAPASAGAHAFLIRSSPAPSEVVQRAPRAVRLFFSEPVTPAAGIKVVRAGGVSVAAGRPYVPKGQSNEIVIPLQRGLGPSPYAVTWSEVDREDGHRISGAFIFSIGAGFAQPVESSAAQGGGGAPPSAVISRWLLLAGLLVAAGSVGFWLLVWRPVLRRAGSAALTARRERADALVLAAALALAAIGGALAVVLETDTTGTRFGRWTLAGACVAAVAAAAALVSRRVPWLIVPASAAAVALLVLPTATGHASAAGVNRTIAIPADLIHLAAVALWIGGVVEIAAVAPRVLRSLDPPLPRTLLAALARRFAPVAAGAVVVLGATGVIRAFNELTSVHQLWTTGYGQALLVKTGVLGAVLVLASLNRRQFQLSADPDAAPRPAWLRAGLGGELVLLAVAIGAVAVLTNVRPGRAEPVVAAPKAATSRTVVFAGRAGNLAVGLAVTPQSGKSVAMRATVLGLDGRVRGLDVGLGADGNRVDGSACGAGCYAATVPVRESPRTVSVQVEGHGAPLRFAAPAQWPAPSGLELVRRAERAITSLRTLVVRSRLASDASHEVTTIYKMIGPDRLQYHNVGGSDSIIIGNRRWDRQQRGDRWLESPQVPAIQQPAPFWPSQITDAHVLRTARIDGRPVWVVSFLDPGTPAWFTAWIDRSSFQTLRLDMVAAAHFMHDLSGPFDAPLRIEPPKS